MSPTLHPPRPQAGTPPRAPDALRDANVVIVGAGPTGLLAALLLHERGVRTTIIERSEDDDSFNVSRAYPVSLIRRGATILDGVPGLREAVAKECIPSGLDSAYQVRADGSLGSFFGSFAMDKELFGLRSSYVDPLKNRAKETEGITLMFGTELVDLTVDENGSIDLELKHNGTTQHMKSPLVLACDGRSSKTLRLLRKAAQEGQVNSSHGFGEVSVQAIASVFKRKTLLMNTSVEDLLPEDLTADTKRLSSIIVQPTKDLPRNRSIVLVVIPMLKSEVARCGGRMTSVVLCPDHDIWKVKTVDEVYALFRENFPTLDVEKAVSRENIQLFIDTEPRSYGDVRRPNSLVGTAGGAGTGGCGVVVLGDAAHSFPPVMAMGLNSAFEDVGVLMRVIDDAGAGDNAAVVAQMYERSRLVDVRALNKINAGISFRRKKTGPLMWPVRLVDRIVRTPLVKRWPDTFSADERKLILQDLPFGEVLKRKRMARRRVMMVVAGVLTTVGAAFRKVASS